MTTTRSNRNKQQTPWEKAKKTLIDYYAKGKIDDTTTPEEIHPWEEFKAVPFHNFKTNFKRLKNNGFKPKCRQQPWTIAKPYIEEAYLNGAITEDMSSEDVHLLLKDELLKDEFDMEQEAFKLKYEAFMLVMHDKEEKALARMANKNRPNPWYAAKEILHQEYVAGNIPEDIDPKILRVNGGKEGYGKEEYEAVDESKFVTNFKRLIKKLKKDQVRADADYQGYCNDIKLYKLAKEDEDEWCGSKAEESLKDDIQNNKHVGVTPKELWMTPTRPEYQEFGLNTFRGHIYQETRRNTDRNYWLVKKAKKMKKKAAKKTGRKYVDDDEKDFYDPVLDFDNLEDWMKGLTL